MKSLVVIRSQNLITWRSCKTISSNVASAYEVLSENFSHKVKHVVFNESFKHKNIQTVAEILEARPDVVAFVDHFPHPGDLIKELLRSLQKQKIEHYPELYIYAYGDFTMNFKWWAECQDTLSHFNVRFLTASGKQQKLLSQMTTVPASVHVPFPVDVKHFAYSSELRQHGREFLKVKPHEHVFLYTGRLSRQKSVLELIKAFAKWSEKINPEAYLMLAGEFDDLGVPYLSKKEDFNQYFTEYQALINNLPLSVSSRIRYLGNLSYDELPTLYCAADTYVSFSVHNDEDFGMAPAEAAATGLPLLMTDWAGLSSFAKVQGGNCSNIPVSLQTSSITFDADVAGKHFLKRMIHESSHEDRQNTSRAYQSYFSIDAVALRLNDCLHEPAPAFEKFSELFLEVASKSTELGNRGLFSNTDGEYNELYQRVYEVYL